MVKITTIDHLVYLYHIKLSYRAKGGRYGL